MVSGIVGALPSSVIMAILPRSPWCNAFRAHLSTSLMRGSGVLLFLERVSVPGRDRAPLAQARKVQCAEVHDCFKFIVVLLRMPLISMTSPAVPVTDEAH